MKYWMDTEFIERPYTIDLISIGLVAEDGREFYAEISGDFGSSHQRLSSQAFGLPRLSEDDLRTDSPFLSLIAEPWRRA